MRLVYSIITAGALTFGSACGGTLEERPDIPRHPVAETTYEKLNTITCYMIHNGLENISVEYEGRGISFSRMDTNRDEISDIILAFSHENDPRFMTHAGVGNLRLGDYNEDGNVEWIFYLGEDGGRTISHPTEEQSDAVEELYDSVIDSIYNAFILQRGSAKDFTMGVDVDDMIETIRGDLI